MNTIALLTCESLTIILYFMILKGLKQVTQHCVSFCAVYTAKYE